LIEFASTVWVLQMVWSISRKRQVGSFDVSTERRPAKFEQGLDKPTSSRNRGSGAAATYTGYAGLSF
jgi:hypothetical protein